MIVESSESDGEEEEEENEIKEHLEKIYDIVGEKIDHIILNQLQSFMFS